MTTGQPDPYATLGLSPGASAAEITAAYRRAVRACHPDTAHPDRDRLARVIAAYHHLRHTHTDHTDHGHGHGRQDSAGQEIPVRVHPDHHTASPTPELRVGPVRRHPRTG